MHRYFELTIHESTFSGLESSSHLECQRRRKIQSLDSLIHQHIVQVISNKLSTYSPGLYMHMKSLQIVFFTHVPLTKTRSRINQNCPRSLYFRNMWEDLAPKLVSSRLLRQHHVAALCYRYHSQRG
jgi:hypothetical protein